VIQNGLMSAQFELMRGEYGSAIDVIHQMLNLREDDRLALSMLGYSYFKLGNFHEAARAYERAFNTDPTKTDAAAAHNVATSSDVGGDSGKALEWNETAYNVVNRENNPTLWKEIVHDRGLFNLVAWMERSRGKVDIYYDRVRSSFKEFTEIGGEALFASYNLCCLYAVAGESLKVQQDEAQDNFATFIRMVNQPGQKTPTNSHVIDRLLGRGSAARGPGEPPSCPAIRTAFARHGWKINGKESWDELVGGGAQITDSGKKL